MNKNLALAAALSFVLPASAQAPASSDPTAFALALHRRLAGGENIMTSPYSLRQALGMAYAGAAGGTRDEMAKVLSAGPAFLTEEAVTRRSLADANGEATLKVANALFLKKGYDFLPAFLKTARGSFAAEVFVREFGAAAVKEINAWVSANTNGKIPVILKELDKLDRAVLLNAVYFKGKWVHAFPKTESGATKGRSGGPRGGPLPETFHPAKAAAYPIKLMSVHETFDYSESEGLQAVRLPYKGGRLAMIAVLPAEASSLTAFRASLDAGTWRGLRSGLERRKGMVAIPRFKFEKTYGMVEPLKAMGMKLPFDQARADFSNMSRPSTVEEQLYITRVVQKTFVAVDEEGTEAAAATAVVMGARGSSMRGPQPFRFVANRPFFFVIEDTLTETILFIGEVQDPR